jgi:hypothetical protein
MKPSLGDVVMGAIRGRREVDEREVLRGISWRGGGEAGSGCGEVAAEGGGTRRLIAAATGASAKAAVCGGRSGGEI